MTPGPRPQCRPFWRGRRQYPQLRSLPLPSVVPDWASEDRDDGHDGWLMLALTGHSDAPVPVILESTDGVSWRLRGSLKFDGDPGF